MTGIAAVFHLDRSPVTLPEIEQVSNVLRRYGPDYNNTLLQDDVGLAFCLRNLKPGDELEVQPLRFGERFVLLFDGRIDNRSELGEMLGLAPGHMPEYSDSNLVSGLFMRFGEKAFSKIYGDFAVIIMDLQHKTLLCARDPMGMRALHYHRSLNCFSVATSPEALFALSWVPRRVNYERVGDALVKRGLNAEKTCFEEIWRIPPGHIIRVSATNVSKSKFWEPRDTANIRFGSDADYVDAFVERFDRAIEARLRAHHTPCATVTGGLNSSSVCVTAASMLRSRDDELHTFTSIPESGFSRDELRGCYFDERPPVRKIAEQTPGMVPHFIAPKEGALLDQITEQIQIGGSFSGGILNGLWVMDICEAARASGHNIMLAGDGGNFIMSYDGAGLYTDLVRKGQLLKLWEEMYYSGYHWHKIIRRCVVGPFVPATMFHKYKRWRRGGSEPWEYFSLINPEFASHSGILERAEEENAPFDAPLRLDGREARIVDVEGGYCDMADWFAALLAHYGVEWRLPTLDRRVFEFCIAIPEAQYLHKGCTRWLIRRAMKGRLPEEIIANRKSGVQASDWFPRLTRARKEIAEKVLQLKDNDEVASILDLERLTNILESWPEQQPSEFSDEYALLANIPQALGAACFIEQFSDAR